MPGGGYVTSYTDMTQTVANEELLRKVNEELERRVAAVEERLSRLERRAPGAPTDVADQAEEPAPGEGYLANAPTLIGRVLLIFGGAYLLRAVTENQIVPTGVGLTLGAAYALFWLFRSFVIGRDPENQATALFYGAASALLLLPLLAEATGRFAMLSGIQATMALLVACVLYLVAKQHGVAGYGNIILKEH